MEPRKWKTKDLLLLLLYAPTKGSTFHGIQGRTRMQKLVFVFKKEVYEDFRFGRVIAEDALPEFEPWKFGPFSKQLYSDIDFFRAIGFISADPPEEPPGSEEAEEYAYWQQEDEADNSDITDSEYLGELLNLTPKGIGFVETRLWPLLDGSQQEALSQFKTKFAHAPLRSILQYVYAKYPDSTEKSEIVDQVMRGGPESPMEP